MFCELDDALEQFDGCVGDELRVFGLLVLLPGEVDGGEETDEGGGGREENAFSGGVEDEIAIAF